MRINTRGGPITRALRFDATVPSDSCSVCRRELEPSDLRLELLLSNGEVTVAARVCRPCLAEYDPDALEAIEASRTTPGLG